MSVTFIDGVRCRIQILTTVSNDGVGHLRRGSQFEELGNFVTAMTKESPALNRKKPWHSHMP